MSYLYHLFVFNPLYNGLIYLMDVLPWIDAGFAVIIFTCIVKLILFPFSKKALVAQARMKEIEPAMKELREKHKNDQQAQAAAMMKLYKDKKVNPFSSIILIFIQLPIIFALYSIFAQSGLPVVNETILYSFVKVPTINMLLFGLIDITKASVILSLIAAVTQYFQIHFSFKAMNMPKAGGPSTKNDGKGNFQEDFVKSMSTSMKYVLPVMVFLISYKISAVIALYWCVSNLFTIGQEIVIRRHITRSNQVTTA